jgi:hypothetical protein
MLSIDFWIFVMGSRRSSTFYAFLPVCFMHFYCWRFKTAHTDDDSHRTMASQPNMAMKKKKEVEKIIFSLLLFTRYSNCKHLFLLFCKHMLVYLERENKCWECSGKMAINVQHFFFYLKSPPLSLGVLEIINKIISHKSAQLLLFVMQMSEPKVAAGL